MAEKKTKKTSEVKEVKEESKAKAPKKAVKKETTKKEEVKKETPNKEVKTKKVVTEAKASALNVKITPRKARLMCDVIRGKMVKDALALLKVSGRDKASRIVSKVVASAAANATNNFNMNESKLYISSIQASDSIKMGRYLPRAKGSSSGMVKRFANIYVSVKEK